MADILSTAEDAFNQLVQLFPELANLGAELVQAAIDAIGENAGAIIDQLLATASSLAGATFSAGQALVLDTVESVTNFFTGVVDAVDPTVVTNFLGQLPANLAGVAESVYELQNLTEGIVEAQDFLNGFIDKFEQAGSNAVTLVENVATGLGDALVFLGENAYLALNGVNTLMLSLWKDVFGTFESAREMAGSVVGTVSDTAKKVWGAVKYVGEKALEAAGAAYDVAKNAVNFAADAVSGIADFFSSTGGIITIVAIVIAVAIGGYFVYKFKFQGQAAVANAAMQKAPGGMSTTSTMSSGSMQSVSSKN